MHIIFPNNNYIAFVVQLNNVSFSVSGSSKCVSDRTKVSKAFWFCGSFSARKSIDFKLHAIQGNQSSEYGIAFAAFPKL